MTTLKTLKDMHLINFDSPDSNWKGIDPEELKQEAIKWVKHFNSKDYGVILSQHNIPFFDEKQTKLIMQLLDEDSKRQLTRQFMKFFNLTKEDLK